MNKTEYAEYEAAVKEFFEREDINHLCTGHYQCPECKVEFDDSDHCPKCGTHRESWDEPHFSWQPCDCCGGIAGDRVFAAGWKDDGPIKDYSICVDCEYYNEYHRLDDTTMMEMEQMV